MILNKVKLYTAISVFSILIAYIGYLHFEQKTLNKNIDKLRKEKTEKLKQVRDSATVKVKEITEQGLEKYDSLLAVKQKIKYIKYEKYRYVDRNLDSALSILANYSYERTTKKDSRSNNTRKTN